MYRVYYDGSDVSAYSTKKLDNALRKVLRDSLNSDSPLDVVIFDTETGFHYTQDGRGNFVGILPQEEVR